MTVHLLASWILISLGIFAIMCNWTGLIRAMRNQQTFAFFPGSFFAIFAAIAIALYPDSKFSAYFWIPLVVDPGLGVFLCLVFLGKLMKRKKRSKSSNRTADLS